MKKYEFLEHTADAKFIAYGKTIEESLCNSAYALIKSISSKKIKPIKEINIKISGKGEKNLIYRFLEEFLYLIDAKDLILSRIEEISFSKEGIKAKITVDSFSKYEKTNEVKAIVYNSILVKEEKNNFSITVTIDV